MQIETQKGHYDSPLFAAILGLIIISVVMVYSSSSVVALTSYDDAAFFARRQLIWAVVGFLVMAVTMRMDHRLLGDQRVVMAILLVSLLLLAATLVPGIGRTVNGSRRWLRLGMLSFQPSELAKVALVVYLSYYIAKKGERIRDFMNGITPAYVVAGVFMATAVLQPDFGTTMTIALVAGIMLFAGGANVLHLGGDRSCGAALYLYRRVPQGVPGAADLLVPRSLGRPPGRRDTRSSSRSSPSAAAAFSAGGSARGGRSCSSCPSAIRISSMP